MIMESLDLKIHRKFFWSDSMCVLRYIANEKTRFKTFVANRISVVRNNSSLDEWKYVDSKCNPSDIASRGCMVNNIANCEEWFRGPNFLWGPTSDWPVSPDEELPCLEEDIEVRKSTNSAQTRTENYVIGELVERISSWSKLKKVVALILVVIRRLKSWAAQRRAIIDVEAHVPDIRQREQLANEQMRAIKQNAMKDIKSPQKSFPLTTAIMCDAEKLIYRYEQTRAFPDELEKIECGKFPRLNSKGGVLHRLDPILCDGLLRVGGRLGKAVIPHDAKHPVILPRDSLVSVMILRSMHESVGHLGRNAILSEARQHWWIIGAPKLIKTLIGKCIVCRRYKAKL
jgi:hypothetical protein